MVNTKPPTRKTTPDQSDKDGSEVEVVSISAAAKQAKAARGGQATPNKKGRRHGKQPAKEKKSKTKRKQRNDDTESEESDSEFEGKDLGSISRQVNEMYGRIVGPSRGKSKFDRMVNNISEIDGRLDAIERVLKKLTVSISHLSSKIEEYGEVSRVTSGKKTRSRLGSKHDDHSEDDSSEEEEEPRRSSKGKTYSIPSYEKRGNKSRSKRRNASDDDQYTDE